MKLSLKRPKHVQFELDNVRVEISLDTRTVPSADELSAGLLRVANAL